MVKDLGFASDEARLSGPYPPPVNWTVVDVIPSGADGRRRVAARPPPRHANSVWPSVAHSTRADGGGPRDGRRSGRSRTHVAPRRGCGMATAGGWPAAGCGGPPTVPHPSQGRTARPPDREARPLTQGAPPPSVHGRVRPPHWPSTVPSAIWPAAPSSVSSTEPSTRTSAPKLQSPRTFSAVAFRRDGACGIRAANPSTFL